MSFSGLGQESPAINQNDVAVIIVNWNTCDCLRTCLDFLFASDLPGIGLDVIVVDNGSNDGSVEMVRNEFPDVRLIRNQTNVGYARAVNRGLTVASGRYILLLNSDAYVEKKTLRDLCRFMDNHNAVGAVSPRLAREDGTVQPYLFGRDPKPAYLLRRGLKRLVFDGSLHRWDVPETREVEWVSGACLMIRKEALDTVGSLDEQMFMFFEDNDLCLRMRMSGWRVVYYPETTVTHIGGKSLAKNPRAKYAYYESLQHFYTKHYGFAACVLIRILLIPYRFISRQ